MKRTPIVCVLLAASLASAALAQPTARRSSRARDGMRTIAATEIVPFYGAIEGRALPVARFEIDVHAVTNEAYLAFVRANERWQRTRVTRLFADMGYLSHWQSDLSLGPDARPRQPVVRVSWFAARAYCAHVGARLPTELEWEVAARASPTRANAERDPAFVRSILDGYGRPSNPLPDVMRGTPNYFGLYDMHGLVWEWVEDFGASMVSADDRSRDEDRADRVCGGAAADAADPADYARFMRYAFRSSLRGAYTVHNLGFRCAKSAGATP